MKDGRNIYLIGFMGTGKTAVGQALAKALRRPFIDLDQWIEAQAGKDIPRIFTEDGEPAFRALETEALKTVARTAGQVVATGGGTVLDAHNRGLMKETGFVIALQAEMEEISRRLQFDTSRPLIQTSGDSPHGLALLFASRAPLYEVADLKIRTSRRSPEEIAASLLGSLANFT